MNRDQKMEVIRQVKHRDELPAAMKKIESNKRMCELGVWFGSNLKMMIVSGSPEEIVGVDTFEDDGEVKGVKRYINLREELKAFEGVKVQLVKDDSNWAWVMFPKYHFDYIYIDSDHRYDAACVDIKKWYERLKSGGVLAGHDYKDAPQCGVKRAVDEFVKLHGLSLIHI